MRTCIPGDERLAFKGTCRVGMMSMSICVRPMQLGGGPKPGPSIASGVSMQRRAKQFDNLWMSHRALGGKFASATLKAVDNGLS